MALKRILIVLLAGAAALAAGVYIAFQVSPWPSALLIRWAFDADSVQRVAALEKHVPPGVTSMLDQQYDPHDADAYLDVFYPSELDASPRALPVVVWIHGGAFISGDKRDVSPYLKVLASKGFVAIGVNYAIAPGATYPTPLRQLNVALAYVKANAPLLHADANRMFLAGDSAGSQIAGQMAAIVTAPDYARDVGIAPSLNKAELRGVVLNCGAFTTDGIDLNGGFGGFLTTVLWSYFGTRDFQSDPRLAQFSVVGHLTADYPPIFISVGNADPLQPQSKAIAERAASLGVKVDTLFFPPDHAPPLQHEYQFNLDGADGQLALDRTVSFLKDASR